jgi:hypothetical protein
LFINSKDMGVFRPGIGYEILPCKQGAIPEGDLEMADVF